MRVYDTTNVPTLTKWTINAGAGANYFIKLVDAATDEAEVSYFVKGGTSITTDVPVGTFVIKDASGQVWCGEKNLFGSGTVTEEGSDPKTFSPNATYSYTITPVPNGNFPTRYISRKQF